MVKLLVDNLYFVKVVDGLVNVLVWLEVCIEVVFVMLLLLCYVSLFEFMLFCLIEYLCFCFIVVLDVYLMLVCFVDIFG